MVHATPFTKHVNGAAIGRQLAADAAGGAKAGTETTVLKWVLRCCQELPRSQVHKIFRLRQVRRESCSVESSQLKRVAAKGFLNIGDRIFLPISFQELRAQKKELHEKQEGHCTEEEVNFIRSLEPYKDSAVIFINKARGMPVQGGIGIRRSLDELVATCLRCTGLTEIVVAYWLWEEHKQVQQSCIPSSAGKHLVRQKMTLTEMKGSCKGGIGHLLLVLPDT